MSEAGINEINQQVKQEAEFVQTLMYEVGKVIVGQEYLVERLLIGLLTKGHILIEGVPGLAKTLSVSTLAKCIKAKFQRIQFTPDLLPADLTGTLIYNPKEGTFAAKKGPIFSNLILADEINRSPAKVQSALLEAMQERQVTIGDETHKLDDPFLVLATQNPIEQEGTYPLPEAQLDRFMLKLSVGYPSRAEERKIMDRFTSTDDPVANPVIDPDRIKKAREVVKVVYIDEKIKEYILDIIFATREQDLVSYGASPRASLCLHAAARAHAFIRGRGYVTPEDVKAVGLDVLRHRVILTYEAEAEEMTPESVVKKIFDEIEVP